MKKRFQSRCVLSGFIMLGAILVLPDSGRSQEALSYALPTQLHIDNQTFRTVTFQVTYVNVDQNSQKRTTLTFKEKKRVSHGKSATWQLGEKDYVHSYVIDELDVRKPKEWLILVKGTDDAGTNWVWGGVKEGQGLSSVQQWSNRIVNNSDWATWQPNLKVVLTLSP
jgi:hypothetical protein